MSTEYRCEFDGRMHVAADGEKPLMVDGNRVCPACHHTHRGVPATGPIPKPPSPWAMKGTRKSGVKAGVVHGSEGVGRRERPVESYEEMQRRVEGTQNQETEHVTQRSTDDRDGFGGPKKPGPAVGASFESGRKPVGPAV